MTAVVAPKIWLSPFLDINQQNNRNTTPPQNYIEFIMSCPKGIVSCHRSGTGNNQGRKRTTPQDNRCFNRKESHEKSNELSSPVIPMPPLLNDSVINPSQLSSVFQQSSSYSQENSLDNR